MKEFIPYRQKSILRRDLKDCPCDCGQFLEREKKINYVVALPI